ncbi:MAG TPA: DMT family transporter [Candidatus Bathyarchaeia archaeon]|jgi:DME family drug/metabolite transporter|nr:DMT family transporter [Candidatus Bathyarchaeia archaeon]
MIGELAALGAALSWTVSAMLYKKALQETKPVSANIIRLTCTSVILFTLVLVIGKFTALTSLPLDVVLLACLSGIIGLGVGDTLYMASLKSIGVARAVPLTCTYPLFNLLWAVLLIKENVTMPIIFGAIIITGGIWLLSREEKSGKTETERSILYKGVVLALATAVVWSISITMINLAVKETPDVDHALAINTVRVIAVAIALFAVSPVIGRGLKFQKTSRRNVGMLIVGGIVALGLGWFLLTYSLIETLESRAVPISSTTPLFSTLVGFVLLREKVTARSALGSVAVVFGVFLIFLL